MAYRFKDDEELSVGCRRIAGEELRGIVLILRERRISKQAEAIHGARRGIKKVRALLRLARFAMPDVQKRENRALRDLGRLLSPLRDADATFETFDALLRCKPLRGGAALRRVLLRERRQAEQGVDIGDIMVRATEAAETIANRVPEWSGSSHEGVDALELGLIETYRRGSKAMRKAVRIQDVDTLHSWRKRAKDHWFHLRLVAGTYPELAAAMTAQARKLEQALGNDHNLAVLTAHLSGKSQRYGGETAFHSVSELAGIRQKQLREEALQAGLQVYELTAKKWRKNWQFQKKNAA